MELRKFIATAIREYLNENTVNTIKVFRGHNENFGLSIKNALWKALYFTEDYDFANKFGDVKTYHIKPINVLDLTNDTTREKSFKAMSDGYIDYDKIEEIYQKGDFPFRQVDNFGYSFTLIDMILDYAKENNYDTIKMIENYSRTNTPIIYVILDENIVVVDKK
jgi:hypothetical protein